MPPRRELEGREPGREEGVEPRIVTLVGLSMMGTVWEKFNTVFRSGKVDKEAGFRRGGSRIQQ